MHHYLSNRSPLIKTFNLVGATLRQLGLPLGRLNELDLLDEACRKTGLSDFGDESFRQSLHILFESYQTEARLTLIGRLAVWYDTLRLLINRLQLVDDRKRYPGIAEQNIRKPLFIVGLPRTGSTLLHNLLAQDPDNRVPLTWEVMYPSPPPRRHAYKEDPRIAKTDKVLRQFDRLLPEFKAIHPMGARLPIECVTIMSHTFLSSQFQSTYHVPSYQQWLQAVDFQPVYLFHRNFLQHLQWRFPAQQWVLKAPAHLFAMESLFAVYPDARIIQTHRNPLEVIGSVASLDVVLRGAFSDAVDHHAIGVEALKQWADAARQAMHVREQAGSRRDRFLDVCYRDLVRAPISTVQRIYEYFDLPFTNRARERMETFLKENPKDKHGTHSYSLSQFGLSSELVMSYFNDYMNHFKLGRESS